MTLEAIYKELMSGSFALERPLRIGYLGPQGSFTHQAAVRQFGSSVTHENARSIEGVFEEVARGHVDYGIVPVENSTIGAVGETIDALLNYCRDVVPCAEVQISIAQALITAPGAVPADIKVIHSKPEALAQCRRWIAAQYPEATLEPTTSTSAGVEIVAALAKAGAADAKSHAAIGSTLAASLNDLPVMFADIQDMHPNVSRFMVLCHRGTPAADVPSTGEDKTLLYFVCNDRPGALRDALDSFSKRGVNLTQAERRICPPELLIRLLAASNEASPAVIAAPKATPASGRVTPTSPGHNAVPLTGGGAPLAPALLVPLATGGRGSQASQFVYVFLVEADGHRTAPHITEAVQEAAAHCVCLHIINAFPRARRVL